MSCLLSFFSLRVSLWTWWRRASVLSFTWKNNFINWKDHDHTLFSHTPKKNPKKMLTHLFELLDPFAQSLILPLVHLPRVLLHVLRRSSTLQDLCGSWSQFDARGLQFGLQDVTAKERRQSQAWEILHHLQHRREMKTREIQEQQNVIRLDIITWYNTLTIMHNLDNINTLWNLKSELSATLNQHIQLHLFTCWQRRTQINTTQDLLFTLPGNKTNSWTRNSLQLIEKK